MYKSLKIFGLILILSIVSGCGLITDAFSESPNEEIVFGTGTFEEGIAEQKSTFSQEEDFLLDAVFSEPFETTEIQFSVLKESNGSEEIYQQWSDTVDPTWETLLYEFQRVEADGQFDKGNYILRMYKNDSELIGEGNFTIE
ncbi:hypothetical protein GH741_01040 [Aquibacillus halophilus]|uniref:Uncharacterized protein n=1 Tax=Aquibacillus halophilus TaxID=930132 RepID=A0A6A8D654_9BACI|nr:hypothetical protein [Aquibacillus halophilus]MRH41255.1 hypothetical protein [Aquibacillus halophilus]